MQAVLANPQVDGADFSGASKKKKKKPKKKKKATTDEDGSQPGSQPDIDGIVEPEDGIESILEAEPRSVPIPDLKPASAATTTSASELSSSSQPIPAIQSTERLVNIRLQLARAAFLILAALTHVGHLTITPPHLESHGLNDLETLSRHRFRAFQRLSSPEAMTYEGFLHRLDCDGLLVSGGALWSEDNRPFHS